MKRNITWSPAMKTFVIATILLGAIWLVGLLKPMLTALTIAALLAYLLDPVVQLLTRRTRLTRPWTSGLVYIFSLLLLAAIPVVLGTVAVDQYHGLKAEFLEAIAALKQWISQPVELHGFRFYPEILLDNLGQVMGNTLATVPKGSLAIISGVITNMLWGFLVLISLYYFLKDGPRIKPWLVEQAPTEYQNDIRRLLDELNKVWGVFLRVQLLIFIVLAILMAIGTLLVIWLYRTGLLAISPLGLILLLILVYTAAQQVDNLWLRPQLMGKQLRLHPGLVFAGLSGALMLGGVLGALLVVPLMATVKVLGRYIYCQLLDLPPWTSDDLVDTSGGEKQESVHTLQANGAGETCVGTGRDRYA